MRACRALVATIAILSGAAACAAESPVPPDQRRSAEQTLLTYPEWFLVFSPAEYAAFTATEPAHRFPFVGHVRQLWEGYAAVTREQLRQGAPANVGYHVMIVVIATSTTVEYALRAAYENTIGRLGWALGGATETDEDRYAARTAQQYVDFIRREPWYLFDFRGRLVGLWTELPAFGPGLARKWERRYALTTEYAIKALYGRMIEYATRAAYTPALMTTDVVVDRAPPALPPDVRLLRPLDDGRALLELPRYEAFRDAATSLAKDGARLVDVAGNADRILVTVLARDDVAWPAGSSVLFAQPILTRPGWRREAALVAVGSLSRFLVDAPSANVVVEHVFDD